MRSHTKNLRIQEYFYGSTRNNLYPHSIEIGFNEVKIFKIGGNFLQLLNSVASLIKHY